MTVKRSSFAGRTDGVGDSTTDNGVLLQGLLDDGRYPQLGFGTFVIASPVIDHNPDVSEPWWVEGKGLGTRILFNAAALPRVSSFVGNPDFNPGDPTVQWAFLSNVNKAALLSPSSQTAWQSGHAYTQGQIVKDGFGTSFACTTAGTSGGSAPAWSTSLGTTTTDNTVTWTSMGSADTIDLGQGDILRNSASGGPVRFPRIGFRNLVIDMAGANAGMLFGADAVAMFENCIFINWKFGSSNTGYADSVSYENIQATLAGNPTSPIDSSWLHYGFSNGDGHRFHRIKCYTKCGIASLFGNQGMEAAAITGGAFRLKACMAVGIRAWHAEMNVPDAMPVPNLYMDRSSVGLEDVFWQPGATGSNYFCVINDSAGAAPSASHLDMDRCQEAYRISATGGPDCPRDPGIYIQNVNDDYTITQRNPRHQQYSSSNTQFFNDGPYWDSAIGAISTALANPTYPAHKSAHPALSRDCVLRKRAGSHVLEPLESLPSVVSIVPQAQPTLTVQNVPGATQLGTIAIGESTDYSVATLDSDGLVSQVSADIAITAAASQTNQLQPVITSGGTTLVVFKKRNAAAGTVNGAPSDFCIIPLRGTKHLLYDTGNRLNGRSWVSTSVPVPNTAFSATTSLRTRLLVAGSDYSGLLCTPTEYSTAGTLSTTSTTLVAVDSTNITTGRFIAPASGKTLVRVSLLGRNSTGGSNLMFGLIDHDAGTQVGKGFMPGAVANAQFLNAGILVTGLTPGKSYQFDLGWSINTGTGQIFPGVPTANPAGSFTPVRMEVWAA